MLSQHCTQGVVVLAPDVMLTVMLVTSGAWQHSLPLIFAAEGCSAQACEANA